jgi:methyl-accepting chemotaxis protein
MSATAEELASQAESLQSSMEFFKTGGAERKRTVGGDRNAKMLTHRTKFVHITHRGTKQAKVAIAKPTAMQKGVALEMSDPGRDAEDNEFEKF